MVKLNSELKETFLKLGKSLKDVIIKEIPEDYTDETFNLYIKTPNFFYKKYEVFLNKESITNSLTGSNIEDLKTCMKVAYFNHFVNFCC